MFSTIRARNAHGGFSEKILDHSKITKMCYFSRFFEIISKTLLTIFPVFAVNVALNSIFQPAKTVCQKKFSFSRYSSLKVRFGPKNVKMGSKESQISRERQMLWKIWFDIRNLQKILFQVHLIRFLPTFRLHGEKLT